MTSKNVDANDMTNIRTTNRPDISQDAPVKMVAVTPRSGIREIPQNNIYMAGVLCLTLMTESLMAMSVFNIAANTFRGMFDTWIAAGSPTLF